MSDKINVVEQKPYITKNYLEKVLDKLILALETKYNKISIFKNFNGKYDNNHSSIKYINKDVSFIDDENCIEIIGEFNYTDL